MVRAGASKALILLHFFCFRRVGSAPVFNDPLHMRCQGILLIYILIIPRPLPIYTGWAKKFGTRTGNRTPIAGMKSRSPNR